MTCRNKIDKKSKSVTDQQTDGRTDKAGCRVACTRLINIVMESTRKTEADDSCVVFPLLRNFIFIFSHVLRDSTPRFVCPSVRLLVHPFIHHTLLFFLFFFAVFGLTAPAKMME